jgi:hypothetical protein
LEINTARFKSGGKDNIVNTAIFALKKIILSCSDNQINSNNLNGFAESNKNFIMKLKSEFSEALRELGRDTNLHSCKRFNYVI